MYQQTNVLTTLYYYVEHAAEIKMPMSTSYTQYCLVSGVYKLFITQIVLFGLALCF